MEDAAVARVCVDSPLPHLDRLFDYSVPNKLRDGIAVGSRCRVRFAGRLLNAVVVQLGATSDYEGKLSPLSHVAASPSYTADALAFARSIARRYGGSLWDVLRLMAPPRVASVEKRDWTLSPELHDRLTGAYQRVVEEWGAALTPEGADQHSAWNPADPGRWVWEALPDARRASLPARDLLVPALQTAASGTSAVVVVPDARAIAVLESALKAAGLKRWTSRGGDYAVLDHDDGPTARYGSYLAGLHGHVRLVIGTRPAVMQPVPRLGLVAMWDDGSTVFEEPHAPYPHARTLAAMRAEAPDCGLILAAYAPSVDAVALVEHGFARAIVADRAAAREASPMIDVLGDERRDAEGGSGWHWMPSSVWRAVLKAVPSGPVLVTVPRAGYVTSLACERCGEWAQCRACEGPLAMRGRSATPECTRCAAVQADWHCPHCQGRAFKQVRQGVERIAEQLREMARDVPVTISAAATGVLEDGAVADGIVVATPGAAPAVVGGYAHAVIVHAQVHTTGALGAEIAGLRLWTNVAALVRPRALGGAMSVVGVLPEPTQRALQTWTPASAAREAYLERAELGLPPARRAVALAGIPDTLAKVTALSVAGTTVALHADIAVVPGDGSLTLIASRSVTPALVDSVRALQVDLSAQGSDDLRIRVDGPLAF